MERLEQGNRLKEAIKALENHRHCLTEERLPSAKLNFLTLYPKYMEYLTDVYRWEEKLWNDDSQLFPALKCIKNHAILLATLACGAGAGQVVCKEWYLLIAEICSFQKKGENKPFCPEELIIYMALAGEFSKEQFHCWPSSSESQAVHDLVLYALMTGNPLVVDRQNLYYDAKIWLDYYDGILTNDSERVKKACRNFADCFWNNCAANEIPYAREDYPCFEPDYNAALAIAVKREHMKIDFQEEAYERFYIGAIGTY